jgi:hypothetical protein
MSGTRQALRVSDELASLAADIGELYAAAQRQVDQGCGDARLEAKLFDLRAGIGECQDAVAGLLGAIMDEDEDEEADDGSLGQ